MPSTTKEYIYRIVPARLAMVTEGPTPEEAARVGEHFVYLQGLAAQNTVLLAGRTQTADESVFGIVIFRASSDEAAREIVENDPAVQAGVMVATLFPFGVALLGKSLEGACGEADGSSPP